jgi:hypothetical protein
MPLIKHQAKPTMCFRQPFLKYGGRVMQSCGGGIQASGWCPEKYAAEKSKNQQGKNHGLSNIETIDKQEVFLFRLCK